MATTYNPIQVRKVSTLPDYAEYATTYNLDINNSYIMVAYPSNNSNIKHNYKLSVGQLFNNIYKYNDAVNELFNFVNEKINTLFTYYIDTTEGKKYISYLWNIPDSLTLNNVLQEWNDPLGELINDYIINGNEELPHDINECDTCKTTYDLINEKNRK